MSALSGRTRFWLLTAAALGAVWITLSLGWWQMSRAAEKAALQAMIDGRRSLAALEPRSLAGAARGADILYRTVHLRGSWLAGNTVFLENRQMYGKAGFFVLTPLQLENSATAVLVQRGWVQRSFIDRAQVPAVPTPVGPAEITGRIAPSPAKLYEFGDSGGGVIRQNLDLDRYSREIGVPLAEFLVLQLGPTTEGLARDWPAVNTGIDKHYGYAFQWFALCGLIVILYGWFQIVRRFISPR